MQPERRMRNVAWVVSAVVLASVAGACGGSSDKEYSNAVDSGAVAPAARLDTSMTRDMPDSTAGGAQRTGRPGVAGDTLSARGRPVGTRVVPDSTRKRP